ncbi:Sop4p KNAG_0C02220 [Huiozyma naganishii CBS 8797]|uniref:Protein SOP4 n=1 Tax=Huiozyma naganishii (strain ATCC MYA-139 / BCRC 22969 / CBS 8797 / KCTC 17520 / NBRC 10181 / NCYC 3082 / Yp74L-3) TaxID=1071383 RepID=J7RIH8_HUIN7|nr:hypothetical protein KNAG_0C02220 [Kazachstania naganishii CBS 8797]CCK69333.1 hypothetical protein KNAG_0C02220 [Kazachstania naganishii CBS 8797]
MLLPVLLWFQLYIGTAIAASIKGRLDVGIADISNYKVTRTYFKIQQFGEFDSEIPYHAVSHVKNIDGDFEFTNLPLNSGVNATTRYVISPVSKDFNLKPNRVLLEFTNMENGTVSTKAYQNYFGREYYPSPNTTHPEPLEPCEVDPYIRFTYIKKAPVRQYLQLRNDGIFQTGFIANIIHSPWKLALVFIVLGIMLFPMYVENFDPETVKAMKEEAQRKTKEKYQIKEQGKVEH